MLRGVLVGVGASLVVTVLLAQAPTPPAGGGQGRGGGTGQGAGGRGGGRPALPTEEQWASMSPEARAYVDKAAEIAGNDPDLQFDMGVFCQASGGATNQDRRTVGVPNSLPRLEPYPSPSPDVVLGGQQLFDNFYWFGDTGVGAWLITSDDGYILFDAMDNEEQARDIIEAGMIEKGLDPAKILYMVFGHHHFDHTGGGEYLQRKYGAQAVMSRDDWVLYLRQGGRGGAAPPPKMTRDIDAVDGMELTVGDVTATIYQMTGHTPGSIGMVVPVKWQGTDHPILLITAGSDVPNRSSFIGGYEHIWDQAIERRVESVMQVHPNTNMNLLARTKYVSDNYPPATNPLLYGAERTERYLNIVRNCTLARMEILDWWPQ